MTGPERILVLDGHPNDNSLCRSLGAAYEAGALASGAQVRRRILSHLRFDPILHGGYQFRTQLEPDLLQAQQDILWADHLVIVHPVWWSGVPALLKGFIDRIFLPGFAFKPRGSGILWDKLLRGRSARILFTQDAPWWYYRWLMGEPSVKMLKKGTLEFCGVAPVRTTAFGPIKGASKAFLERCVRKAEELGRKRI